MLADHEDDEESLALRVGQLLDAHERYNLEEDYQLVVKLNFSNDTSSSIVEDFIADFKDGMFAYTEWRNIALVGIYVPLFLLATVSNLLVFTMIFSYRPLRNATNYLLANLSLADLMVTLICMPVAITTNIYRSWIYGNLMCKATTYIEGVVVSATVFTLTAMSVARCFAIRQPMSFRKMFNHSLALKVIAVVWTVSLALFVPVLIVRSTDGFFVSSRETRFRFVFCVETWSDHDARRLYAGFLFAIVYVIPGLVIVISYSLMAVTLHTVNSNSHAFHLMRGRRKVARYMIFLALIFALCWLPYNITMLILETSDDYRVRRYCFNVLPFTLLVGHSNSAINPILYCFLTKSFRLCLRETLLPSCRMTRTTRRPRPPPLPNGSRPTCTSKYKRRSRLDTSSSSNTFLPKCFSTVDKDNSSSSYGSIKSTQRSRKRHGKGTLVISATNVAISAIISSSSALEDDAVAVDDTQCSKCHSRKARRTAL